MSTYRPSLFVLGMAVALSVSAAPLWLRDAKISPDGKNIAFTYKGDIFTVPVTGGDAVRITSQPTYETAPVWSPDGKKLAFASDRFGNFDVFMANADGSSAEWKRLTFNSASETPQAFTPDGKEVLFSAVIQDPAESVVFPSGRMTELYAVNTSTLARRQVAATPVSEISWAPDGKSFLYQDTKGFEDIWRKHHTSSVTRDIWRFTPATGKHEQVVVNPGEDLYPVDGGETIYFLSERAPQKSINVYAAPASNPAQAKAITNFKEHPVRFLSGSKNGTLAFTYDGELYTLAPGGKPQKVPVDIRADFPDQHRKLTASSSPSDATASPNGKNVAIIYRGDVYVTSTDYATTKQITDTPAAERSLSWANDSTLYFSSEEPGFPAIYRATMAREGEPDLARATVVNVEKVLPAGNDRTNYTVPQVSPDGKTLAFIADRNKLGIMDLKSKKIRMLTDGSQFPQRNGRFGYTWSPDSKWIALEIIDRKHDPYTDIAIINVADGKMTNITNSGYFDEGPRWIMDGKAIAFASERYGMRNHASWGSQMDVFFVFMNKADYYRFKLPKEERELLDKAASKDTSKVVNVELDGIEDRQVRITPFSTSIIDFVYDPNGKALYYSSEDDGSGSYIWKYDTEERKLDMNRHHGERGQFEITPDGKNIFLYGKSLSKFGDKIKPITFRAVKNLDPQAEREGMFDYVVNEEAERFYTKDMHGVDWKRLTDHYRKFLPHIANNYDFAELLSELLGELNVSHTGGRFSGTSDAPAAKSTSTLGALYDLAYQGPGAKIEEVLVGGPLFGLNPAVVPGEIVVAVDGEPVTVEQPVDMLLADAAGHRTLVDIKGLDGKTRQAVVRPISRGAESDLLYKRWVRRRAADVDRLSGGRLGYVHIESMNDDSFRKVYSDLLGKYNDREGVVIDVRWNGGGRLHEDIEVLLSGEKYFTQEVRGTESCDMPSRRWNKPSIMIIGEPCYSNAHGTPWVYKHRGLGKLVGMPVPGTMTSVNWVRMVDPSMVFGIPVVCYRLADGSVLENQQLEPDVKVANDPNRIDSDRQLETAVKELLKDIDSRK